METIHTMTAQVNKILTQKEKGKSTVFFLLQHVVYYWLIWYKCQKAVELSVVCCRRHLWIVILATGLIIETSHFAQMYLVHAHELLGQFDLYFF